MSVARIEENKNKIRTPHYWRQNDESICNDEEEYYYKESTELWWWKDDNDNDDG